MTMMLVFSEIMTFMWQYYVTEDTKSLRQWEHSFNGLCSPSGIIQSINRNIPVLVKYADHPGVQNLLLVCPSILNEILAWRKGLRCIKEKEGGWRTFTIVHKIYYKISFALFFRTLLLLFVCGGQDSKNRFYSFLTTIQTSIGEALEKYLTTYKRNSRNWTRIRV